MEARLEVVTLGVTDVDKAIAFYRDQVGFTLDVDYRPHEKFRVVQLTPPGSACSIQLSVGLTNAAVGSTRATYLAVTDIESAHRELAGRGVAIGGIRHKANLDDWQGDWLPGVAPDRRDYASVADFADPDGNIWVLQEIGHSGA